MGKNVVVLGTQWGDEVKGKIVDLLTDNAAAVVSVFRIMISFELWPKTLIS